MRPSPDQADETKFLGQYIEKLGSPLAQNEQQRLQRACLTFSALHPGQSCLGRTDSTEWLPAWAAAVPAAAQASQVAALGRWWSWLFERGVLDDNVLAGFYPCTAVLREPSPVVLTHNLQRQIAHHLEDRGPRDPDTRRRLRRRLENLNRFLHRQQPAWDGGAIYEANLSALQQFDRFVAGMPDTPAVVSADLVQRWVACGRHLSPKTQKSRLGLVRQFSIYLRRIRPESYVPDRFVFPVHVPTFKAYVYSPDEYRALLRAALALPAPKAALRPKVFYTVLLLLYATGLRIGEALRLRLRDVDLEASTFLIREKVPQVPRRAVLAGSGRRTA